MKTYKNRMNSIYYETWNVFCFRLSERNFQTSCDVRVKYIKAAGIFRLHFIGFLPVIVYFVGVSSLKHKSYLSEV
jgi:hypothetical protein